MQQQPSPPQSSLSIRSTIPATTTTMLTRKESMNNHHMTSNGTTTRNLSSKQSFEQMRSMSIKRLATLPEAFAVRFQLTCHVTVVTPSNFLTQTWRRYAIWSHWTWVSSNSSHVIMRWVDWWLQCAHSLINETMTTAYYTVARYLQYSRAHVIASSHAWLRFMSFLGYLIAHLCNQRLRRSKCCMALKEPLCHTSFLFSLALLVRERQH